MKLGQLLKAIGSYRSHSPLEDFQVRGISCNSQEVKEDFVFIAIKGNKEDGHRFIPEAIDKGAKVIITQSPRHHVTTSPKEINFIEVEDARKALAKLAAEFYGYPSSEIKVAGITGTNGKTTITYLIEAILKEAGATAGVIGTINYRFKDRAIPSKNTTPGPIELQSMLRDMLKEGAKYAVMEVSSHALDQERAAGIKFSSAVFTNLTQDHLDYHQTLENYFQAKARLFSGMAPGSFAVINNDNEYGRRLKAMTPAQVVSYGIEQPADMTAGNINFDIAHSEFSLISAKDKIRLKTSLIGRYNIYNILAAAAWALEEGIDLSAVKSAIEKFTLVPGRLERINFKGDFSVFVDYAHTEDALKNVIGALRPLARNKLIVVFGCGGERDQTKRPKMGCCVTELADYAILTSDNPRSEDPQKIIDDIKKGISRDNYSIIPERRQAIRESLGRALPGDIVLVAGKGHENYQVLKDKTLHFDDCKVIRECLKSMNY
ncbi:MAG: UDP-N-acetylmuramoyl-L-alanyl-D-glutamate--2,6-diaminopimelate ligase [Candidatus Omnitrophica bacterium]|nr:UDP-N-acetylmuramoyl-L-alanyl-D-glutamate--2,6-diaminopimelate ligase [Candidatus Omnitrophota bacterium]